MNVVRAVPAVLSALLLAAHFLRTWNLPLVGLSLLVPGLLFVRRRWATRVVQGALVVGALEWLRTLWSFAGARQAAGEPWTRLAFILGGVAAWTLVSAALLRPRRPGPPPPAL